MEKEKREELKNHLLELDPCIEFDKKNEDKLIGYAERFGCHFIPLYKDINTFLFNNPEDAIKKATSISDKVCHFDGLDKSMVGYVVLENGEVALLHDKEILLENLAKEYEEDGMEIDEDDSHYSQAIQWYDYNIIGTGLSDMTTPAFACTEEFSLPITLDS